MKKVQISLKNGNIIAAIMEDAESERLRKEFCVNNCSTTTKTFKTIGGEIDLIMLPVQVIMSDDMELSN